MIFRRRAGRVCLALWVISFTLVMYLLLTAFHPSRLVPWSSADPLTARHAPAAANNGVGTVVLGDQGTPTGRSADGQDTASSGGGDTVHAGSSSPPLLTLFSTWADNKDLARNLTMANWAQLRPAVLPVLFTNSSVQAARARRHGWHTMPVTTTAVGVPVLKYMYLDAVRRFNTTLVAYANGDILFASGIVDSVRAILADPTLNLTQKHFLIIGQRTNVDMVTAEEALTFDDVATVARKRGELFTPNGVDYFITNRNYPWDEILELVIGRMNYDSYLVLNAIKSGHVVVDVTKTAVAVHQTTEAGNEEHRAHRDWLYNRNMLRKRVKGIIFKQGRVDCAPWETKRDTEGRVIVQRRPPNPQYCLSEEQTPQ